MQRKSCKISLIISTLLILSVVFVRSSSFFDGLVWLKWEVFFFGTSILGCILAADKHLTLSVNKFYILVSFFLLCLLIKTVSDSSLSYARWCIVAFWILYSYFSCYNFSESYIYELYTFIAFFLALVGCYQKISGYTFMTGTYDNPAGFSVSLVCLLPFVCYRLQTSSIKSRIYFYLFVALIACAAIIFSQSRAAIIALIPIFLYYIPVRYKKYLCLLILLFLVYLTLGDKSASSIGRFFILKVSASMLEFPSILWGYGFGFFKSQYMVYQAGYFQKYDDCDYGLYADNIFHPMNEYVLFLIEQGVILSILLLYILFIYMNKVRKDTPQFLSIVVILIVSCFSYPFRYPLILIILSYSLSSFTQETLISIKPTLIVRVGTFLVCIIWINGIFNDARNHYMWKKQFDKVRLGKFYQVEDEYLYLSEEMESNPNFLFNYSSVLFNNGEYEKSLEWTKKCSSIIDNYDVRLLLAENYAALGDSVNALYYYKTASNMCPNRFLPLYGIFNVYYNEHDTLNANSVGKEILSKPVKVESDIIDRVVADVQLKLDSLSLP